jgi:hypothetical protein
MAYFVWCVCVVGWGFTVLFLAAVLPVLEMRRRTSAAPKVKGFDAVQ